MVSLIPIAVWRKSQGNCFHKNSNQLDFDLELTRRFSSSYITRQTVKKERADFNNTPSKIPVLIKERTRSEASSSEGSTHSDSSLEHPLSPEIDAINFTECNDALMLVNGFPSRKSNKFQAMFNWSLDGLQWRRMLPGTVDHINKIHETSDVIKQISNYFQSGKSSCGDGPKALKSYYELHCQHQGSDSQYFPDLLENELKKESRYQLLFPRNSKINKQMREKVVEWVISASKLLKYSNDTVHLTVALMDNFLQVMSIKNSGWGLLGLTTFHLATKYEGRSDNNLKTIWRHYKNLAKITIREIKWMEAQILNSLKFYMYPPTPKFFTDLALTSDKIVHSEEIKNSVGELAHRILLENLKDYDSSLIPASYKSEIALQIATEYLMCYKEFFFHVRKTNRPEIKKNSIKICYDLFRKIVQQYSEARSQSSGIQNTEPNKEIIRGI